MKLLGLLQSQNLWSLQSQILDPETDFLSDDIAFDTILKDVSEFESNQVNAQNTIQNHQTCQSGQQFPVQVSV